MAEFENDDELVVTVPLVAHESASARYCRAIGWIVGLAVLEAILFAVVLAKIGGVL